MGMIVTETTRYTRLVFLHLMDSGFAVEYVKVSMLGSVYGIKLSKDDKYVVHYHTDYYKEFFSPEQAAQQMIHDMNYLVNGKPMSEFDVSFKLIGKFIKLDRDEYVTGTWQNLTYAYEVCAGSEKNLVTKKMQYELQLSEEQLFYAAMRNNFSFFGHYLDDNNVYPLEQGIMPCSDTYAYNTLQGSAALLLNPSFWQMIRTVYGEEYVVIPSSTCEVLLMKKYSCMPYEEILSIVQEVNDTLDESICLVDAIYMMDSKVMVQ